MLSNITNSAVNAGKNLVSALTIQPITDGFNEYETKMNSIQTILTNTAHEGTTLKDVTSTLNELNDYADKTIYNFAEMTKNIGTFTAAGVDLKTSTAAIKGTKLTWQRHLVHLQHRHQLRCTNCHKL